MNARRVDKDNLRCFGGANACDAIARRLRLGRHNRDLFAENSVQQRRLSNIGPADNGNVAGAKSLHAIFLALLVFLCHKISKQTTLYYDTPEPSIKIAVLNHDSGCPSDSLPA